MGARQDAGGRAQVGALDHEHATVRPSPRYDRELSRSCYIGEVRTKTGANAYQDDDGFKLYEARAIARYLVRKYKPESALVPSMDDLKKYALFEQAMSVEAFNFAFPVIAISWEKGYKPCVSYIRPSGEG